MPDQTGLDVLQWLRRFDYTLASVVVSGDAEKEIITQSLRGGASDFLEKPVSLNELAAALDKAVRSTLRRRENITTERVLRQVGVL
jgi:FixJ family two-component response regulator